MGFKLLSCCLERKGCDTNAVITSKLELTSTGRTFWSSRKCNSKNPASVQDFWETKELECLATRDRGLQKFEMNDFVFGEQVGRGTKSEVRLLLRGADKVKFAGKMLQQGSWWSLINEASIMSELSGRCANIASVEGIIVKCKCLILPYYRNGDLGTALMRDDQKVINGSTSEFPFFKRLKYIWDACKAVTFLHRSSICHRDLAMRNFLLSDDMEDVLLTDFTLSRFVEGMTNQCVTFTAELPKLSAPESSDQGIGGWLYSLKTDTWGLGMTMFEIITKKNFEPTRWKQKMPEELPQSRLPPKHLFNKGWDLWFAIRCCWNTKPEKRPWSWEVMDKIKNIIENPVGGKTSNLYFTRYSPKLCASLSTSSFMNCLPITYTMKEFMTQTTSEMEFSDCVTDRRHHSSRESISKNPNLNLTPIIERSTRKIYPTKSDSCSSLLRRGYLESYKLPRSSPSFSTVNLRLNLVNDNSNVTNVAYCKDRHFFDDKKMINQQESSLNINLPNENSDVANVVYYGDRYNLDEKNMAYEQELSTSDGCVEIFLKKQLSNSSSLTNGSAYNCDDILEETQCSILPETISKHTSRGISIIL